MLESNEAYWLQFMVNFACIDAKARFGIDLNPIAGNPADNARRDEDCPSNPSQPRPVGYKITDS